MKSILHSVRMTNNFLTLWWARLQSLAHSHQPQTQFSLDGRRGKTATLLLLLWAQREDVLRKKNKWGKTDQAKRDGANELS